MKTKVWADLKVGDHAIEVFGREERTVTVMTVGRKWITVEGGARYSVRGGRGGTSNSELHSERTLAEARSRAIRLREIREICWRSISSETMRKVLELVEDSP